MSVPGVRPRAIGLTAHAAAVSAGGRGRVLARLGSATYLAVGGEIVWLASMDATLHPRAILGAPRPPSEDDDVRLEVDGLTPWQPGPEAPGRVTANALDKGWRALAASSLGTPTGFGALLTGGPLTFPLAGVRGAAVALARACARNDATAAADAALGLLGLGGGLTPSGDDYAGGALFARALVVGRTADAAAWRRAAARVVAAAPARTHPISAALLADLAAGRSWAPLHDLVAALAAASPDTARAAARRLVALGHTSGWDMLAGVGAGLGMLAA
jgi:hypothetical protein